MAPHGPPQECAGLGEALGFIYYHEGDGSCCRSWAAQDAAIAWQADAAFGAERGAGAQRDLPGRVGDHAIKGEGRATPKSGQERGLS